MPSCSMKLYTSKPSHYRLYSSIATFLSLSLITTPPLNHPHPPLSLTCQIATANNTPANTIVTIVAILAEFYTLIS